jgi:hypothetical protein
LFGKEHVQVYVQSLKAQWMQWCPIPADLRDGLLVRGNVLYENPSGGYRMSRDLFEGVLRTEDGGRYFVGTTQHTFYGRNFADGQLRVVADLRILLNQRLPYNPMMFGTNQTEPPNFARYAAQPAQQPAYELRQPSYAEQPAYPQPQSGYAEQPSYPQQQAPYSQLPVQQPGYLPQPSYAQQPAYAEPPGSAQQPRFSLPPATPNQKAPFQGSPDGGF